MVTTLAPRSQMVTEITPTNVPWQSSWHNWLENFDRDSQESDHGTQPLTPLQVDPQDNPGHGCGNFRGLLCSESLGDIWEALLGRASSQSYVIDLWTQLLNPN